MKIESFYHKPTGTLTHIVIDEDTKRCAIIDPVTDYDQFSGRKDTSSADQLIKYVQKNNLTVEWILETHIHADHITASKYLKNKLGGDTGIGSKITEVLEFWVPKFDTANNTPLNGEQFDCLFENESKFKIGSIEGMVMHTPGHTPACASYLIEDAVFVGDTLFAPNAGTARCDFPGGSAKKMYETIMKLYQLPDETRVFLCHDYPEKIEDLTIKTTIQEEKAKNTLIKEKTKMDSYIKAREKRDSSLAVPKLILPSIQTNMRLGDFDESASGIQYIKIPINII